MLLALASLACGAPAEVCVARIVVNLPAPSPLADEGDVARVVIKRGDVAVFDDVVDLIGSGQAGGSVDALSAIDADAPVVLAGRDLTLSLTVFSVIANEVVATGRARFDCLGDSVDVPLYLGPANTLAPAAAVPGARSGATLTPLADGRVLLFGGSNDLEANGLALPAAALFDPIAGTWCTDCLAAADQLARREHTATALADGRVIIAGGALGSGALTDEVVLFDPAEATFTVVGTLARRAAGAALVSDDAVLVVGGFDEAEAPSASAFLIDASAVRAAVGSLAVARAYPAVAALASGDVLVAGGEDEGGPLDSLELFHADETFGDPLIDCPSAPEGQQLCARRSRAVAVVLDDGNVLVTGGIAVAFDGEHPAPDGDVFLVSDQRALAATATPSALATTRAGAAAIRLSCDGPPCPVLMAGGRDAAHALFHIAGGPPAPGARDYGGTLLVGTREVLLAARAGVAAAPLPDGSALIVGGEDAAGRAQAASARFTLCEQAAGLVCPAP